MQLYQVNGTVTLNRVHPSFAGASLKTAEAYGERLLGRKIAEPDLVVVWDDLGATTGSVIAVSDGAEAAQPFRPSLKPVDAYNAAIIDEFNIRLPACGNEQTKV
jgi:microcompartment protein CcmK/EutM